MFVLKTKAGMSLIEILVMFAIIIILTVAAIPSFISLYQKHHLMTTVQNLNYVLQFARSTAVQNNQTVYVVFQTGDNWCYGMNAGATCNCATPNSCGLGTYSRPKTQDLSLTTTGMTSNTLTFDAIRGATNTTSTVTFTIYNQTPSGTLKISPLGNMQICSSTISGYSACT